MTTVKCGFHSHKKTEEFRCLISSPSIILILLLTLITYRKPYKSYTLARQVKKIDTALTNYVGNSLRMQLGK